MTDRRARVAASMVAALSVVPAAAAHTGVAGDRTAPELSDIALAVFAVVAIWFVRRALRARFRRDSDEP